MYNVDEDSSEDVSRKFNNTYVAFGKEVMHLDHLRNFTRGNRLTFTGYVTTSQGKWVSNNSIHFPTAEFHPHPPRGGYIRSLNCVFHVTSRPGRKWRLGWRHGDAEIVEISSRLRTKSAFKSVPLDSPRWMYDLYFPEYMKPQVSINMVLEGRRHAMPISPSLCIALDEQRGCPVLLCRQNIIGYWDNSDKLSIFEEVDWLIPFLQKQGVPV